MRKGTIWETDGSMNKSLFIMIMSNLLSTNVVTVVSILVSVYRHKQKADYTDMTVHYTLHTTSYIQQTKIPNGPFSHSWSQFYQHSR